MCLKPASARSNFFDRLPTYCFQLRSCDALRGDFGQGHEDKGALQHARVRNGQRRAVDAGRAVEQQVQVQFARGVAVGA